LLANLYRAYTPDKRAQVLLFLLGNLSKYNFLPQIKHQGSSDVERFISEPFLSNLVI